MAVTGVCTRTTTSTTTSGTNTPTLAWGTGQNRTTNNILVLVVTAAAVTSVTLPTTVTGWTESYHDGSSISGAVARTCMFWKVATGADAVPSVSVVTSGTTICTFTLIELTGADW